MQIGCLLLIENNRRSPGSSRVLKSAAQQDLEVRELLVVASLARATKILSEREVDLVLLDLDLLDSSSLATLRAVRAATDAAVIVLSSQGDELVGVQSLREGADDFVLKRAVSPECLRAAIVNAVTQRKIRKVGARIGNKMTQLAQLAEG